MPSKKIKILFASYECDPFYKQGGLGDVAASLPKALKQLSVDIRLVLPYYNQIKHNYPGLKVIKSAIKLNIAGQPTKFNLLVSTLPSSSVPIYFIQSDYFAVNDPFAGESRTRFIVFSYFISRLADFLSWPADLIHLNDWQTGMVPSFVKLLGLSKIKTLFTIHNLAYTGRTELDILNSFGFRPEFFSTIENNKINIMREAILSADYVSTVSPHYAQEILTPAYGCNLVDALKKRKGQLLGILNGIDYTLWNPAVDQDIYLPYDFKTIHHKMLNKLYLQKISGFAQHKDIPLVAIVSRLVSQKGFDLIQETFDQLMRLNINFIILGTGQKNYADFFSRMHIKYKDKFKIYLKFNSKLAKQIYAGADIFLMPSRYEPCGLGQLIAMCYGTLPLARATGGLKDTVKNFKPTGSKLKIYNTQATGFVFNNYDSQSLLKTITHAIRFYKNKPLWNKLIFNAMHEDFSWSNSAKKYLRLYRKIIH